MLAGHHIGQLAAVAGHAPAVAHTAQQPGAAFFVAQVARQDVIGGVALAEVVAQAGKAHGQWRVQAGAHVQHHHGVNAGVHLGVVVGPLGHAPQVIQLGQQYLERAAGPQHLEHARGPLAHQATGHFLPHALGHQVVDLAVVHHFAHQLQGVGGHGEIDKAGGKPGHAQDAHRVFAEGGADVAQHLGPQVGHAAEGIDQPGQIWLRRRVGLLTAGWMWAVCLVGQGFGGDGVDGEVAPGQVLLQRHIGCGVEGEALVAGGGFALGAGQGDFIAGVRVQKHRKVFAHRQIALVQQSLGRAAHHHPVALVQGQTQQGIAHRAAHHVNVHQCVRCPVFTGPAGRVLQSPGSLPRPAHRPPRPARRAARTRHACRQRCRQARARRRF